MGEDGYIEDVEWDENVSIRSTYICWIDVSPEKAMEEVMRVFKKTEEEIITILTEYDNKILSLAKDTLIKPGKETNRLKYLNGLSTKDLDSLYFVFARQNAGNENIETRKEIERIVVKRAKQFENVGNEIENFNNYSEIENWNNFELNFDIEL